MQDKAVVSFRQSYCSLHLS